MGWNYSNTAVETTLSGSVTNSGTSITVGSTTGFPVTFPYTLVLDYGAANEEVVNVTGLAGSTLTIERGQDGTSGQAHSAGAVVVHALVARDAREPQEHIDATSNVHGLTGGALVVGTTQSQTLTNKAISGADNTLTAIPASALTGTASAMTITTLTSTTGNITTVNSTTVNAADVNVSDDLVVTDDATVGGDLAVAGSTTLSGAVAASGVVAGTRATNSDVFTARVTADTEPRCAIQSDGDINFGPGNAATDAKLYRVSAGTLQTDGSFNALGSVTVGDNVTVEENLTVGGTLTVDGENLTDIVSDAAGLFAYKTADEQVSTSTVMQNDNHLFLSVEANSVYKVQGFLMQSVGGTVVDIRVDFTFPSGCTWYGGGIGPHLGITAVSSGEAEFAGVQDGSSPSGVTIYGSNSTPSTILIAALLVTGGTAGTLQLRWAQGTSHATATVLKEGSWLHLQKMA